MTLAVQILRRSVFLAGPTASGKTAVSIRLAQLLEAEIVSLDSMAIYTGMDIGTAKPLPHEQEGVPHHLIDVAHPSQDFSVAQFVSMATIAATNIVKRNRTPLFVGGTGLYLRSLLRGLFEGPEADWDLRDHLQSQAMQHGRAWLHEQLKMIDATSAQRLHPNDTRRIIRAIEVYRLTGRRLSDEQSQHPRPVADQPRGVIWIDPPRHWLHNRINERVDQMMKQGLLPEVKWLMSLDPPAGRTALQALGYRELIEHLSGRCSLDAAVEQIKTGTRQFAKRQHTWFRNLEECRSVSTTGTESADELSRAIKNGLRDTPELDET
ncbi:MAG: tRNA (adenosine(37)-N6)-dimethylallyltransferase MiaA [Planctomycetaceae bacterium]